MTKDSAADPNRPRTDGTDEAAEGELDDLEAEPVEDLDADEGTEEVLGRGVRPSYRGCVAE